jgi:hypothetical protein
MLAVQGWRCLICDLALLMFSSQVNNARFFKCRASDSSKILKTLKMNLAF